MVAAEMAAAGAIDRRPPDGVYFGASTISIWRPSMRG